MKRRTCPRCHSPALEAQGCLHQFLVGLIIAAIGGTIGLVIWPLLIAIPIGLLMAMAAPISTGHHKCRICGRKGRPKS